jgi:hypothetical protein
LSETENGDGSVEEAVVLLLPKLHSHGDVKHDIADAETDGHLFNATQSRAEQSGAREISNEFKSRCCTTGG